MAYLFGGFIIGLSIPNIVSKYSLLCLYNGIYKPRRIFIEMKNEKFANHFAVTHLDYLYYIKNSAYSLSYMLYNLTIGRKIIAKEKSAIEIVALIYKFERIIEEISISEDIISVKSHYELNKQNMQDIIENINNSDNEYDKYTVSKGIISRQEYSNSHSVMALLEKNTKYW